jgi:pyrroline-5-carboxylate reductase
VASKGGTTERALSVLDERDFSGAVVDAMKACTDRAEELGRIK